MSEDGSWLCVYTPLVRCYQGNVEASLVTFNKAVGHEPVCVGEISRPAEISDHSTVDGLQASESVETSPGDEGGPLARALVW